MELPLKSISNRGLLYPASALAAVCLAVVLGAIRTAPADDKITARAEARPTLAATPAMARPAAPVSRQAMLEMAATDPSRVARIAIERYRSTVRDYRCIFTKQERINGELKDSEEIRVLYRNEPLSVYMQWQKNADEVKRALYIDRKDFVNSDGEKIAKIEPAGAILRIFVSELTMPIHGDRARAASRRTIDEFGFQSTLNILEKVNELAADNGELAYKFDGEGRIDGRPTFVFVRTLPLKAKSGKYPDAKMILHLDQEWLLPTAVYSYSDAAGKTLLGSYVLTKVELNPGLTEADFRF